MEKLENKLVDMRDMYEERKETGNIIEPVLLSPFSVLKQRISKDNLVNAKNFVFTKDENPAKVVDPFYESQENHNLIGVANIFLEVLSEDVTLDYHTPIISQQGDVAGRLQVAFQFLFKIFFL